MFDFPRTTLDRRLQGMDAYVFDTNSLFASIIMLAPTKHIRQLSEFLTTTRKNASISAYAMRNGLQQLAALQTAYQEKRFTTAAQQEELRTTVVSLIQPRDGSIWEATLRREEANTLQIAAAFPSLYAPRYERMMKTSIRSVGVLHKSGTGAWVRDNRRRIPSAADCDLAATVCAAAYLGSNTVLFSQDTALRQTIQQMVNELTPLKGKLYIAPSPFESINQFQRRVLITKQVASTE